MLRISAASRQAWLIHMAEPSEGIELSIDTASVFAGVAIAQQGVVLGELNWRTSNNHSAELIPAIDSLLDRVHRSRESIAAIFVNKGPGSYAGLRVGISTAMGLALALDADLVAVGRLELDAYPHGAFLGPVCAVHQAGRGDLAWAVYACEGGVQREVAAPRLGTFNEMIMSIPPAALYCGELAGIEAQLSDGSPDARLAAPVASLRRAAILALRGWERYAAGERDNPVSVEPLYLREPPITQARPRPATR